MAEPTCVMHPFSYTSPTFPDPTPQENSNSNSSSIMCGIGDSVSFGRFMQDNLEWERWSSFNGTSSSKNKHVEEAAKYSRPGSVAQKKAYFEAHFKRIAALKAAALLDQQSNALTENPSTTGEEVVNTLHHDYEVVENVQVHEEGVCLAVSESELNERVGEDVNLIEPVKSSYQKDMNSVPAKDEEEASRGSNNENHQPCDIIQRDKPPLQKDMNIIVVPPKEEETSSGSYENQSCGIIERDKLPLQKKTCLIEEDSVSIVKKNPPLSSYMSPTIGGRGRSPLYSESGTNYAGSVYPGKENYATPIKKKTNVTDPDKKKTPLRLSINREINRLMSPVIKKIGHSSKVSKEFSTPLKTPKTVNGALESPRKTPSRGVRSLIDSFTGDNKASGSRWHIFSSDASMSPSTGRHRLSSPIIPNSFCLSGDRAGRRKQKLEEKFNATTTERPPQPSKFKEKAEAELNKLRQSFCFKATMSSPDHYKETETLRSPEQKDDSTQGKSPRVRKLKQPTRSTSQSKVSLPPRRPTTKHSTSKNVQQNKYSSPLLRTRKTSG